MKEDESRRCVLTEEPLLLLLPPFERHRPERALPNHHVRTLNRHLGRYEMTVDLPRNVSGVEHLEPGDLDHKLGRAEDVAGVVRREADPAREMDGLVVVDRLNGREGGEYIGFGKEGVVVCVGPSEQGASRSRG